MLRRCYCSLPIATFLFAFTVLGCTSTRTLTMNSPEPFERLNGVAADKDAVVELSDGTELPVRALRAASDSVSWINPKTDAVVQVPVKEVVAVRLVRRGKGSLQGLGIGVATGAVIGALLSLGCDDIVDMNPADCRAVVVPSMGVAVGLLGSVFGALRGNREVFRFQEAPDTMRPTEEQPLVVSQQALRRVR